MVEKERKNKQQGGYVNKMAQLQKRVIRPGNSGVKLDSLDDVSCTLEVGSPEGLHSLGSDIAERAQSFSHRKKKNETKNRSFDRDLKRRASDVSTFASSRNSRGKDIIFSPSHAVINVCIKDIVINFCFVCHLRVSLDFLVVNTCMRFTGMLVGSSRGQPE